MAKPAPDAAQTQVVDPVCGEIFPPSLATFTSAHEGRQVWFCSSTCKGEFEADPQAYPPLDVEDVA